MNTRMGITPFTSKRRVLVVASLAALLSFFVPMAMTGLASQHNAGRRVVELGCGQCHTQADHPRINAELLADCASCHDGQRGENRSAMMLASEADVNAMDEEALMESIEEDELTLTSGMSVPLYYEDSRIGAHPHDMVLVPAGEFIMGSDNRLPDEGPQHKVDLDAFYIDKYEVTNLQYKKFIDDTHRRSPTHFRNRTFPRGKADHPVTFVNWYDAKAYCEWAGKRLPTDEEWEKAARGSDGRIFPWGNEFDVNNANTPLRWQKLDRGGDTTPVGAFEGGASPYGVHDMSGNVWEWTASWYKPYPGNTRITENYGEKYKTLKGGSWWDCSFYRCGISAPVFNRSFFLRTTKNKGFGFRCARDARSNAS